MRSKFILLAVILTACNSFIKAQNVARIWNEQQLKAIRIDAARPPVQARNLFHVSLAMYDAWAAYDANISTYLLGKTIQGVTYTFFGIPTPVNIETARSMSVSYAAYRVLKNRYALSPNWTTTSFRLDSTMNSLGYNINITNTGYLSGDPAALGNYIAAQVIAMGNADGANQLNNYAGTGYAPVNAPLVFANAGNTSMTDVTRWQPLTFVTCIDQNGIPCGTSTPGFIGPHWGRVFPFSMPTISAVKQNRNGYEYPLYHDPGIAPTLSLTSSTDTMSMYCKWGHEMTAIWSGHLDPNDNTMWDISPASRGNVSSYPTTLSGQVSFYNLFQGGPSGLGYTINPVTGSPYTPQMVKRGDYTRIVSQYWADGPNSETPPGHWYVLLNTISEYPGFQKKIGGVGNVCPDLEWYVKSYFCMGAAMHDAAIACWGIKGWYDSPRPISMIRKMAALGQCTNPSLPNYHPGGIDLIPGYIEQVTLNDPPELRGASNMNVNKIKLMAWKGFASIPTSNGIPTGSAGVGWMLAERWMPYQRETFVTPPFAGYVSGHSTYSRAAALLLTNLTGSPYFPGGLYEVNFPANSGFLVFEAGPSTNIKLQYASFKDASDEASLSRIWGGIHPPFDDMPGRLIGEKIGNNAFAKANALFNNNHMSATISANANPVCSGTSLILTVSGTNIPLNATYIWRKNGGVITNNSAQLITNSFSNNDIFSCEVKGNGYSVGSNELTITTSTCNLNSVEVKAFIQGYYIENATMQAALYNQLQTTNNQLVDVVEVSLHETFPPYNTVETQLVNLKTDGTINCSFTQTSGSYYLAVKHRNAIETWSANPINIGLASQDYDFSTAASQAYGNNQIEVETGIYTFYSGDINHDGAVDAFDYLELDADIISGAEGFQDSDLNGDGVVDAFDYILFDPNIVAGQGTVHP